MTVARHHLRKFLPVELQQGCRLGLGKLILPQDLHDRGFLNFIWDRKRGYLFETMHASRYSPRRIQQIVQETAAEAKIEKQVYPHLLRQLTRRSSSQYER